MINKFRMNVTGAMILMAAIMIARGSSFIFSKWLLEDMQPMNILAVRFVISFLILAIVFCRKWKTLTCKTFLKGMALGGAYTANMVVEMYALRLADAGTVSFIENTAIVIVPLYVAIGTRTLPRKKSVICAAVAFAGVALLTTAVGFSFNLGVFLAVVAALIFGGCIVLTDAVTNEGDPLTMGIVQIGFMGLFSAIITFMTEQPKLPQTSSQWGCILMLAVVCSCFGFSFQPVAQKYLTAETAGVFTAINPLTTCILGIILGEEQAEIFKIIGGLLVVTGVLLSVFKWGEKKIDEAS